MNFRLESTVGQRGQTVIPKPIRDQLKLQAGDRVWFTVEDGRIVLEAEDRSGAVEAFLADCVKRPLPPDLDWDAMHEAQFEARYQDRLPRRA